jgi:general nucleoside transport system permease protein
MMTFDITSIVTQIVSYGSVYALASLGIVLSGRAGIFNISAEGVMLAAAAAGFATAAVTKSWVAGAIAGALVGAAFGIVLSALHEGFRVDQFILGIALIIAGAALSDLIDKTVSSGGSIVLKAPPVPKWSVPGLSDVPVVGAFFDQNVLTYFMYACVVAAYVVLYRTKRGLDMRAIGESPKGADVVGIPVRKIRMATAILGSALVGVAGAYLPLVVTSAYSSGMVAGRGFMTIGIAIFANWKPQLVLPSALIFAAFEVLAFQAQLLIRSQQYVFLVQALPFVGVLLIMMIFRKHIEFPAAIGTPYVRE